jgi:hypothetical protein
VVNRRHGAVDVEDHVRVVEGASHVRVHRARRVLLAHPVQLGVNAEVGEGLQEERREMARVVWMGTALRGRDVSQRDAHVLLDGIGRQQRLGVHRVEILYPVAELYLAAMPGDRPANGVMEHDAAQAAHMDRA